MLKKYVILTLSAIVLTAGVFGQENLFKSKVKNLPNYDYDPLHFGFVLALNQMHFTINPVDDLHMRSFEERQATDVTQNLPYNVDRMEVLGINYQPEYGFTVGIVGDLRLGQYYDLRFIPSLSFGERVIDYKVNALDYEGDNIVRDSIINMDKRIPSTYIDFPLMVKYKSKRYNNVRGYLIGGVKYSMDLASLSDARQEEESPNNILVKLKRHDFAFEIGVGFDYYLSFFKFGTEIKMSYSPVDPLDREGNMYTESIGSLSSKYFQLSFTFE